MTRQHDNEALVALWRREPIRKIAQDLSRRRCQRDSTTAYDHNGSLESGSDGGAFLPNATGRTPIVSNDLPRELPPVSSSIFDPAPPFRRGAVIDPSAAQLYRHTFSPNKANISPTVVSSIGEHWGKTELMVLPYQMVRQFIENFFCGQNIPFSIVRQDLFLHSLINGNKQYCSSALIRIICCLGCRNIPGHVAYQSYCAGLGDRLFVEALQVIGSPEDSDCDFPNGQALLLMGLHQLAAGEYDEAQRLTDRGLRRLYLVHRRTEKVKIFGASGTMQAMALLGAVCFARMLRLSIGHIQSSRLDFQLHSFPILISRKDHAEGDANVEQLLSLPRLVGVSHVDQDFMAMPSSIFQLTDWVYTLASRVQITVGDALPQPLLDTYHACLSWYASTFVSNSMEKVVEPFVHLYYHFCLLTLFRPFCHVNSKDVSPVNICLESIDSVLTLKNVCGQFEGFHSLDLVPIFVYAAAQAKRCITMGCSAVENVDGSDQAPGISYKRETSGGHVERAHRLKETARQP